MSDEKAVKVGDLVSLGEIRENKYDGCELKKIPGAGIFKITKAPDPKPEVPDEPMNRGAVVTIEGDDEFIAIRFAGDGDTPYPFIASYSDTGPHWIFSWKNILSRAAERKIIVHKMVATNEAPSIVHTYSEWLTLPEDELSKYRWLDTEGDPWVIDDWSGKFEVDGAAEGAYTLGEEDFPLTRTYKIG